MANGHGGYRPGSGRKPDSLRSLQAKFVDSVLEEFKGEGNSWRDLLERVIKAGDLNLEFKILEYLTDRKFGKPAQEISREDTVSPVQLVMDIP